MKRLFTRFLREFSGFLLLIAFGIVSSVMSLQFKEAWDIIWAFRCIVFPALLLWILSMYWPKIKGIIGEKVIVFMLLLGLDQQTYKVINNLLLKQEDGRTAQIDHVVVSIYGIFVIETKNYNGWIFGNENDKYWTQVIFRHRTRFLNPIWQNSGHIKMLKETLGEFNNLTFYPIVVFMNTADLKKISAKSHAIYTSELLRTIKAYDKEIISNELVDRIYTKLLASGLKDRREFKWHTERVKSKKGMF